MEKDKEVDNDDPINEEEMNKILKYINNLDYAKYQQDLEIREALQLLKNKMEKEEEEKRLTDSNEMIKLTEPSKDKEEEKAISKQEEEVPIKQENKDKAKPIELTDGEKAALENKWNSSTNIKEANEEQQASKESKKQMERLYTNEKKKLAVHSYQSFQKLLQRQGIHHLNFPIKDSFKISIQSDKEPIVKSQYASIPFLKDQPYI